MGEAQVSVVREEGMEHFIRQLLDDVQALEYMLTNDWFETDTIRIGAEQEMCLVNKDTFKAAPLAMTMMKKLKNYPWADTEIALFNLENNLTPQLFTGDAFSRLEKENRDQLAIVAAKAKPLNTKVVLTGVLPTLRKFDLDIENLTPKARYRALIDSIDAQREGEAFELRLTGIDEILVRHDSPLLEACNTSYQVHLQVTPQSFVKLYNIAMAVTAPVMALAANSPIVFGRRLWHESRIALFQQALDVRTTRDHLRERSPRVHFGSNWINHSILDIYREDIARFRALLAADITEDSLEMIRNKKVPKLRALQVHNSTVYRWNRPCYGISDNGMPHLRIENRVLPAGPTVVDQTANAAFWTGLVTGMALECDDVRTQMSFADVRDNFSKAALYGIDSKFTWFKDKKISAVDLIQEELLPMARRGLESRNIDTGDIDRYLGIIGERAKAHTNGARWQLRSYTKLIGQVNRDEALSVLTAYMIKNQESERPVHEWEIPDPKDLSVYHPAGLRVEEFMETDLFTVRGDDLLDLVVDLMDWRRLRYVPVEDDEGQLVGLITNRHLLRYFSRKNRMDDDLVPYKYVRDLMIKSPHIIAPSATIKEAMYIMRDKKVGCLPVIKNSELIGIITEMDFLRISGRLIDRLGE